MIRLEHVSKKFVNEGNEFYAVNDVSLEIRQGEIFGIIGFSGAGKSTLVRCMNLLEKPTEGNVYINGTNLVKVSSKQLRRHRRDIGMIFQQFHLLSQRNVIENVLYPLEIAGVKKKEANEKAIELLEIVGLSDKQKAYPSQLSGGQKQRVAIARALATNPQVLLCDEATSALDPLTTRNILALLKKINRRLGVTVVIITHEMRVVEQICDRVAVMNNGIVEETGTVNEVFLNPKSETAKRLIFPNESHETEIAEQKTLRIAFDGQSASEPIISSLSLTCNTLINILSAKTENIGGRAYGQMLIELPEDNEVERRIKDFLDKRGISYEEGGRGA